MNRRSTSDRLANLQQKRAQLDAQISDLVSRQKQQERKLDTRRKVLLGAFLLYRSELADQRAVTMIAEELPGFLQRERDFELLASLIENCTTGDV